MLTIIYLCRKCGLLLTFYAPQAGELWSLLVNLHWHSLEGRVDAWCEVCMLEEENE